MAYCIVPWALAEQLHEPLRRHFSGRPEIEVIVESRGRERRRAARRGEFDDASSAGEDRRMVRNADGRRVGQRRAVTLPGVAPELPRKARPFADQLVFVERLEPADDLAEDLDTARLVTAIQAGERELFADLYRRYFDRVYVYFCVALGEPHSAEDLTQQVFTKVFEGLPRYERRHGRPFRAWLFTIVRNAAIDELRRQGRTEPSAPELLDARRERLESPEEEPISSLAWLSDRELLMFVERLPLAQRQVLTLRHMLGFSNAEIASIMDRSVVDIRILNSRGLSFLRSRLSAVGRDAPSRRRAQITRRVRFAPVAGSRRWALH